MGPALAVEAARLRKALAALLQATLEDKCCTTCKVEGHDGCAAGWPAVQEARAALGIEAELPACPVCGSRDHSKAFCKPVNGGVE